MKLPIELCWFYRIIWIFSKVMRHTCPYFGIRFNRFSHNSAIFGSIGLKIFPSYYPFFWFWYLGHFWLESGHSRRVPLMVLQTQPKSWPVDLFGLLLSQNHVSKFSDLSSPSVEFLQCMKLRQLIAGLINPIDQSLWTLNLRCFGVFYNEKLIIFCKFMTSSLKRI